VDYLGELEQLVLFAVLRLGDEAYGVTIRDEIHAKTGREVSAGAIYTMLARLEERGLVKAAVVAPAPGKVGRPRKHYVLRPAGARALRKAYGGIQALAGGMLGKLTDLAEGGR